MILKNKIEELLKKLPDSPGVYIMQDKAGKIIYVGKAKSLNKRVPTYFRKLKVDDVKTRILVKNIKNFSTIVTNNEAEALLLEDSLIKKHLPKYNIDLKDQKRYPYLRLDVNEPWPLLEVVRFRKRGDKAKYFGPYSGSVGDLLKQINRLFELRKCKYKTLDNVKKTCLYYDIGQCFAPCVFPDVVEIYKKEVKELVAFLKGDYDLIINKLKKEMEQASGKREYEKAARTRDRIIHLERISSKQKVITGDLAARDIWALAESDDFQVVYMLKMQNGRIVGQNSFTSRTKNKVENSLERVVLHDYQKREDLPAEIILPQVASGLEGLFSWLKKAGLKVVLPQKGEKYDILKLARKNALKELQDKMMNVMVKAENFSGLYKLKEALKLPKVPQRIDCFDISNIQGSDTVASMTVLRNGIPEKKSYRKYIIENEKGEPNDFASMEQVLTRRYYKVMQGAEEKPDLIVIDGGKGQLTQVLKVLSKFKLTIAAVAVAKKHEELFVPGRAKPIILNKKDPGLKLIQIIRDEAHRFAVTFHKKRRQKRTITSELDNIKGIGKQARKRLIKHFGSVAQIREKKASELQQIVNSKQARSIVEYFFR